MKISLSFVIHFIALHDYSTTNTFDGFELQNVYANLKLTFNTNVNANVMQSLVNIEKPRVLFFNKTKPIIKSTSIWTAQVTLIDS